MQTESSSQTARYSKQSRVRFNLGNEKEEDVLSYMFKCVEDDLRRNPAWNGKTRNEDKIVRLVHWLFYGNKQSLLMLGGTGSGKTVLAKAIGRVVAVKNLCPYFYDMRRLLDETREGGVLPEWVYDTKRMLILDDIGTEPNEVQIYGNRYSLINEIIHARYARFAPTIFTSNFGRDFLTQKYGERAMSRISEMCDIMIVEGGDMRK